PRRKTALHRRTGWLADQPGPGSSIAPGRELPMCNSVSVATGSRAFTPAKDTNHLERVCDYLVILVASHVRLSGEVSELLASHWRLSGPRHDASTLPSDEEVIDESHTDKQSTFLVRTNHPILDPAWNVKPVTLEDLVLAYLSNPRLSERGRSTGLGVVR